MSEPTLSKDDSNEARERQGGANRSLTQWHQQTTDDRKVFELVVTIAATLAATPAAAFVLADGSGYWLRGRGDLMGPDNSEDMAPYLTEIDGESTGVLPDPTREDWFREASGPAPYRYHFGMPVLAPDRRPVGVLCALDNRPQRVWEPVREGMSCLVKLIEHELELRSKSLIDPLTGLFNRRYLDQRLGEERRRSFRTMAPISVLIIDIDFFKLYNDSQGHIAGDGALREVASALRAQVRRPGDLIARYGGEEFVAVLTHTPSEGAVTVAERMIAAVEGLHLAHAARTDGGHWLTISIGISSSSPTQDYSAVQLLQRADRALYRAKAEGRNRYCITDGEDGAAAPD